MSKFFNRGFIKGFTAGFGFWPDRVIVRDPKFDGGVANAWRQVGKDLSHAEKMQGADIVKKRSRKSDARPAVGRKAIAAR